MSQQNPHAPVTNRTYPNQTVGILPPEARGCGDIETVRQMVQKGNSPDYDPSLDKSVCYSPDQIKYVDQDGKPVAGTPLANEATATVGEEKPSCSCDGKCQQCRPPVTMPGTYEGWKRFLRAKQEERPFLFALLAILALFIFIKLIK